MKNKFRIKLLCMVVLAALLASGCQLAKEDSTSCGGASSDEYVGFFITTEKVNDKFYAEMTEVEAYGIKRREYEFKEYEGIPFCQIISSDDGGELEQEILKNDAVCNIHMGIGDETDKWSLEGNVYYSENVGLYINEVYQKQDGAVYVVPDDGLRYRISAGVTSEVCATRDEKEVVVNVTVIGVPEKINFICMGADNDVVWSEVYEPEKMPESIDIPEGTEYIIVDTVFEDGYDSFTEIYDEKDQFVETFKKGKTIALEQVLTDIKWK